MSNNNGITLSVVVPAYNEEEVLANFHRRLEDVLDTLSMSCEILYVNDGSNDGTLKVMQDFADRSLIHGFLVSLLNARNYLRSNPKEALQIVSKYSGTDPSGRKRFGGI